MEEKDFKPGISFRKHSRCFKVVKNESKEVVLPDMLLINNGQYYEFYGNIDEIKDGIVEIYHHTPIGDKLIRESVTLSGLTLIGLTLIE